jgi:hypothetical protein
LRPSRELHPRADLKRIRRTVVHVLEVLPTISQA